MKRIKLSFLIVALLAVTSVANAQLYFGVRGGLNLSNMYGKEVTGNNVKPGFHVGLTADYDFSYNVGLQTGLMFNTKGLKVKESGAEYSENLMYLQLPVHLAYKIDVTPGTKVVLHGGPYLAYGVGGKRSFKAGGTSLDLPSKVFGSGITELKEFDFGAGIGVDFEFNQLVVGLGWDMGLINLANVGTRKTQNAYLSLGYKF